MRMTVVVDRELLREARKASGAPTDAETVRLGLEMLVKEAAYKKLSLLKGSEPTADDVPRRREVPGE